MRAFVVSSPSTISRFPDFSFSPLLPSTPFSFLLLLLSPATVFFHSDPLTLFSRVRQISWRNAKTERNEANSFANEIEIENRDRGFHPRAGDGRTREKVKERGGCTGSIVCGVNVLHSD